MVPAHAARPPRVPAERRDHHADHTVRNRPGPATNRQTAIPAGPTGARPGPARPSVDERDAAEQRHDDDKRGQIETLKPNGHDHSQDQECAGHTPKKHRSGGLAHRRPEAGGDAVAPPPLVSVIPLTDQSQLVTLTATVGAGAAPSVYCT